MFVNDIVNTVKQFTPAVSAKRKISPLVVITGGEPLMHQLDTLTAALKEAGFETNIEMVPIL